MGILEDVMTALDRIPTWRRMQEMPDRIAALEARINALEAQLQDKPAGQHCPVCGARAMQVMSSAPDRVFGDTGMQVDQMKCQRCGHTETRHRDTFQSAPPP